MGMSEGLDRNGLTRARTKNGSQQTMKALIMIPGENRSL